MGRGGHTETFSLSACYFIVSPSPNWTFLFALGLGLVLGLGLGGLDLGLGLDNWSQITDRLDSAFKWSQSLC